MENRVFENEGLNCSLPFSVALTAYIIRVLEMFGEPHIV